jgi:tetratricopeptide (TPR) repeat protein
VSSGKTFLTFGDRLPGRALFAGLLFAALLWCYGGTASAPLLLDDEITLVRNRSIQQLGDWASVLSPPAEGTTGGRPLANLSFALTYAVSGVQPWAHRLANVCLHGIVSLLAFGLVRRMLQLPGLPNRLRDRAGELGAAIALLWAVHPLLTQCVTYVSQRTEVLMAGAYLLTLYAFIRAETEPSRGETWRFISVAACWLGSLCKEAIATVPFAVLLCHWLLLRIDLRTLWRERLGYYAALTLSWTILAVSLDKVYERGVTFDAGVSPLQYATVQVSAVVEYLRVSLWPHPLIFDHSPLVVIHPRLSLPHALVLISLLGGVAWSLVRRSRWGFLGSLPLLILAPTSSFIPVVNAAVAENRASLPSLAVVAAVVVVLALVLNRWMARLTFGVLMVSAAWATVVRNHDYADAISLWRDTVEKDPGNPRAHGQLAFALYSHGQPEAALWHYREALRLDPDRAPHHTGAGVILANQPGGLAEAQRHLAEAVRLKPNEAEANANLGSVMGRLGKDLDGAERHLREALRLAPGDAGVWFLYGEFFEQRRSDLSEARRAYRETLRLRPGFEPALLALARLESSATRQGGTPSSPSLP